MQAYEFNAVVSNGMIHIPEQFYVEKFSNVRVILLVNPVNKKSHSCQNKFSAMRLKTKGFMFNREEVHER